MMGRATRLVSSRNTLVEEKGMAYKKVGSLRQGTGGGGGGGGGGARGGGGGGGGPGRTAGTERLGATCA